MSKFTRVLSITSILSVISMSAFSAPIALDEHCFGDQIFCMEYPKNFTEASCKPKATIPFGLSNASDSLKNYCSPTDSGNLTYAFSEQSQDLNAQFKKATEKSANKKITYKKMAKKYFIVSGFINNNVFYQVNKKIDKDQYVGFIFQTDKKDKKKYDNYLDVSVKGFLTGYK